MNKKILYLISVAVVAILILVPSTAFAQGTTMGKAEVKQKVETTVLQPTGGGPVGGPVVILPAAAALLAGAGVLTYAIVRRRR